MTFVNYSARELNFKLVYYGPLLAGKSTNLQYLFDTAVPGTKRKLVSLATETERTLFFDFLPQWAEEIHGFRPRIHLYTVCGVTLYEASRKLVLKGVDGVCFVADSRPERLPANIECLEGLSVNLIDSGREAEEVPLVFQYNKRDLPDVIPIREMSRSLNPAGRPEFEAIATAGVGVTETFQALARMVMDKVNH